MSLFINVFIYIYYQVKILYQETRNSFLNAHISMLNERLKPIHEYENRVNYIKQQMALITYVENERDDMVAFFQKINKITPTQIYFTNVTWVESTATFSGVTSSPVYLADFLDKLRLESAVFYGPVLKSNNATDAEHYSFVITSLVKENLVAESDGQ